MICPNCNSEVKDGMKFCPKCGTEIPQTRYCSECGTELKDGMRFCPKCGRTMEAPKNVDGNHSNDIACPICNHPLSVDDKTCPNCHRDLFYNCNNCKNDFTYGELIKNQGCCPKCGIRIINLHNIPDDKYPFADSIENIFNNIESANPLIQEGKTKIKKGLKYIVVGFACCLVVLFFMGMCSGGDVSRFSGRYYLDDANNPNWHYIINVSDDGRCVGGLDGDKFLGYVSPISDDAFKLSDAPYTDWDLIKYRDGRHIGSGECNLRFLVFDIKNNRVYFDRNDYLNKDISNPEYSILHK